MSKQTDKIFKSEKPNNDNGWIEYALSLGWEELPMGYEYVTDNAAEELSALREKVERLERIEKDLAVIISNAFSNGGAYMESKEADAIAAKYWATWQDVSNTALKG